MHSSSLRRRRPPFARRTLAAACLLGMLSSVQAATYAVSTEAELRQAILAINAAPGAHFIDIRGDIQLSQSLPVITNTVSIRGNGFSLDGNGQYQLLALGDASPSGPRILVQVSNLTLSGGRAVGRDGTAGGGGGLGAGGALAVGTRADVLLTNVSVRDSAALGGAGAAGLGGDGGGYQGGAGGSGAVGAAGAGSFGAGGGSSLTAQGGAGGLGGGGGAGATGGDGGLGAGGGGSTGGGGGAGLGGGIFVAQGGSLSVSGTGTVSGNAATGGAAGGDGTAGAGAGGGVFLAGSGNLVLRVRAGQTLAFQDGISDSVGEGLAPASSFASWNVLVAGGGGQAVDTADPTKGVTYGRVELNGTNRFSGSFYVEGADAVVQSLDALGTGGGVVALNDGGLVLANGLSLAQDIVVDNGGGRVGVDAGSATLANDISGTGTVVKTGAGRLVLAGTSSHVGDWRIAAGSLVLDSDVRLGGSALVLDGGGIVFGGAFNDLRTFTVASTGTVDNGGFNVTLAGVNGWTSSGSASTTLTFAGGGTTTLSGAQSVGGNTVVTAGRVLGGIGTGQLQLAAGATYGLNGADREVTALGGAGTVDLGANTLTLALVDGLSPLSTVFTGRLTGTGGLVVTRGDLAAPPDPLTGSSAYDFQVLAGLLSTYSGGTTVKAGAGLMVAADSSLGSNHNVRLQGGAFGSLVGSSSAGIILDGGGGLVGDLNFSGVISGTGDLYKVGQGTLTLNGPNTYVGNTVVVGEGSYLALAHPDALGLGRLQLTQGGGLKVLTDTSSLRPVEILDGVGSIDVGTFDVQSTGGITGVAADSRLRKEGSGRLLLTGDLQVANGVEIAAGTLQVGDGGAGGDILGNVDIAAGARLVIDRSDDGVVGGGAGKGNITGEGSVELTGTGTVRFAPTAGNTFSGGLLVRNGLLAAQDEKAFGFGTVTLDDNGGLLLLGDLQHDASVGSGGGRVVVNGTDSFQYDGDFTQAGLLTKAGTGTLVLTGVAGDGGDVRVAAGTLQVGSGVKGVLASDVLVDAGATLVFGREDVTQFGHVISGDGTVIKRGAGELVLTADQLFAGTFQVEAGSLRVGLGGDTGSLSGNVDLAATTRLVFDRGDASEFRGDTTGAGSLQKSGPGQLIVVGNLGHSGGTTVISGELQVGDGGTVGSISGDVTLVAGTRLAINRSDDVVITANLSGEGQLVQRGAGVTVLTGNNTQTGGVLITDGRLGVDSDARLGVGDLQMDGGLLRYESAFADLRALRLRAGGGGLDTNGLDVTYAGQVSGDGTFRKAGAGRLTVTGLIATGVQVEAGELHVGNGGVAGAFAGDASIAAGATLALDRSDFVYFSGRLDGAGDLRQVGAGELRFAGDGSSFSGRIWLDRGRLRLDGTLGGDLVLASDTGLSGVGSLSGNLDARLGQITPGNAVGTLTIGGNLQMGAGSELEIDVTADGTSDHLVVGGTATLGGSLKVIPQAGNFTLPGCCTYTILNAAAVTGTFDRVDNPLIFLSTSVRYSATDVQVSFVRNNAAFSSIALGLNQQQVASAIDTMEAANPADPVAALIAPLDEAQARTAFEALGGDTLLVAANASAQVAARFSQLLSQRASRMGLASRGGNAGNWQADLARLRQGGLPLRPDSLAGSEPVLRYDGPTSMVEGIWMEAVAVDSRESADNAVGSASGGLAGQLLALGVDGYWRDELLVGLAAGTLQGDLSWDNRGGEGTASASFAGLYARWDSGAGLQYKGALSLARQDNDVTRRIPLGATSARTQATLATQVITAGFEAGLPLHLGSVGLRPHALVTLQAMNRDAVNETGSAGVTLDSAAANDMFGEFGVGIELSRPWLLGDARWAQISGGLALLQPYGDTQREQSVRFSGGGPGFTIKATPDDSAALALSLGAEAYLTSQLALWGGYEGRVSGTTQEHNGVLSMQYRW